MLIVESIILEEGILLTINVKREGKRSFVVLKIDMSMAYNRIN